MFYAQHVEATLASGSVLRSLEGEAETTRHVRVVEDEWVEIVAAADHRDGKDGEGRAAH